MERPERFVTAGYDAVYRSLSDTVTLQALWREHVLGPEYPQGFEHLSFLTAGELDRMAGELHLQRGEVCIDLGCGTGGPGLWLARKAEARLVGLDASPVAISSACHRAETQGLSGPARFAVSTFDHIALEDAAADAVMSVDALQYAASKRIAFQEIARILRPGGRLVFTAFELEPGIGDLPVLGADPVGDYRSTLDATGFACEAYEATDDWRARVTSTYGAIRDARDRLEAEMGLAAAAALMYEVSLALQRRVYLRRVFVVAAKRPERAE